MELVTPAKIQRLIPNLPNDWHPDDGSDLNAETWRFAISLPNSNEIAIRMIRDLCLFELSLSESRDAIFSRSNTLKGNQSIAPANLIREQFHQLSSIFPHVANNLIRARIADVLWTLDRQKSHEFATVAIHEYELLAKRSKPGTRFWIDCVIRAIQISCERNDSSARDSLFTQYCTQLTSVNGLSSLDQISSVNELSFVRVRKPSEAMIECASALKIMLEDAIQDLHAQNQWADQRTGLSVLNSLCKRFLTSDENNINERIAESFIQEIDSLNLEDLTSAHTMENIAAEARKWATHRGSQTERRIINGVLKSVQNALLLARHTIAKNMTPLRIVAPDFNPVMFRHLICLTQLDGIEALQSFVLSLPLTTESQMLTTGNQVFSRGLTSLFQNTVYGYANEIIWSSKGQGSQQEDRVEVHAVSSLVSTYATYCIQVIEPQYNYLCSRPWDSHLLDEALLGPSSIQDSQRKSWLAGIIAGLRGDLRTALSILFALTESSIRSIASSYGIPTQRALERTGQEMESTLGFLLEQDAVKTAIGADLSFMLRLYLSHPYGPNLRNRIYHGHVSDEEYDSINPLIAFILILRFVLSARHENESVEESPSQQDSASNHSIST